MAKQVVIFEDLGKMDYQQAWELQEKLLQENVGLKSEMRRVADLETGAGNTQHSIFNTQRSGENDTTGANCELSTVNYLLFVEHPPVYTLGKSGHIENILMTAEEMKANQIQFFKTNRGGDITFHGPGQIVGYPILDLEHFYTDIGKYLRNLEEVIILTLAEYGLKGERSAGETGVWIDPAIKGKERKICAIGVRCSRWITMHGFAFNVNTDLSYFDHIIPCGIQDKQVTSLQKELGKEINFAEVKEKVSKNFALVFDCLLSKSGVYSQESGVNTGTI